MKGRKTRTREAGMGILTHMMIYLYMAVALLPGLTACDCDAHEGEFPLPDGNGGLVVGLVTGDGVTAHDVHFFVFGMEEQLAHHEYFSRPEEAALHISYLTPGIYTVVAVLNTGADFMPPSTRAETPLPDITLPEFTAWLKGIAAEYPGMLTGMGQAEVRGGEVTHTVITLSGGTEGITLPMLRIRLTLPEPRLPDYTPAKAKSHAAEAGYTLRCVAELYKAGTEGRLLRKALNPALQADGTYLVELEAGSGNYDLRLWTDYTRTDAPLVDTYYHTESLKAVGIVTGPYTANTDAKDAAYIAEDGITLPDGGKEISLQLQRPLAKYRLVATDVPGYRRLTEIDAAKWPPLEELTVSVYYENFFPSTFNILNDNPTDALTGIRYHHPLPDAGNEEKEMQVASDWVLVNGKESSVSVTVVVTDAAGRVVSSTSGIPVAYRRSYLTTVRGDFLTAGVSGGGIRINTEWEGEYNIYF